MRLKFDFTFNGWKLRIILSDILDGKCSYEIIGISKGLAIIENEYLHIEEISISGYSGQNAKMLKRIKIPKYQLIQLRNG